MPIVFYAGGLAAVYRWNLEILDKYSVGLFIIFVILCISIVYFGIENRNYLRIISPILIWPAASLLVGTRLGSWFNKVSKYSFFTFLLQGPILLALWLVYQKELSAIPYWLFWIVTPIITAIFLAYTYNFFRYVSPKIMRFLLGGR